MVSRFRALETLNSVISAVCPPIGLLLLLLLLLPKSRSSSKRQPGAAASLGVSTLTGQCRPAATEALSRQQQQQAFGWLDAPFMWLTAAATAAAAARQPPYRQPPRPYSFTSRAVAAATDAAATAAASTAAPATRKTNYSLAAAAALVQQSSLSSMRVAGRRPCSRAAALVTAAAAAAQAAITGIPMGLDGSLPLLLLNKISYKQQSVLSLTSLPFSVKLLWAPLVDSCYVKALGRRRSWLVPLQFLAGFLMIFAARDPSKLQAWLGDTPGGGGKPDVLALSLFFGFLYFLMATQDIAVDGWALTLLSPENKGLASTCNTVGQTLGYCFAYAGFLALNDPHFSSKFLGKTLENGKGVVDLPTFIAFWGWVFVVTTTVVLLFFKEGEQGSAREVHGSLHVEASTYAGPISGSEELHFFSDDVLLQTTSNSQTPVDERTSHEKHGSCEPQGVVESYKLLWKLLYLPPVRSLLLILLSCRVGFAAVDAATQLKIIERGVPKEELAFLAPLLVPFAIVCPFLVSKWITGAAPLRLFMYGYAFRLVVCCVWAGAVAATPVFYGSRGSTAFFGVLFLVTTLYNVCSDLMFVSMMAFFARVSDPRIGGSYMTFLNTVANVGSQWPRALSLWLMDSFAIRDCTGVDSAVHGRHVCVCAAVSPPGAKCPVVLDGYFVQVAACVLLGVCWSALCWPRLQRLQQLPLRCWRVFIFSGQADNIPLDDLNKDSSSSSTSSSEVAAATAADVKKGE
ncbi:hypothetical protein Esti_003030 [Eimeria stiedai]